jgi:hypothetical protein
LVTVGNILAAQAEADALLRRSCVPPSTGAARVLGDQGRSVALRERPSRQSAEVIAIRSAEQVEVRGSASIVGDDPRRRAECSRACREAGTDRSQPNALIESCYADGSLWFPVDYDGQIGFVSGEFIRGFVEDEPASFRVDAIDVDSEAAPLTVCYPTATTLEVGRVQEFVNIRQAPGFEQDIVATAALGAELTVVNALQVSGVGASEQIRECQTACGHQQSGNQSRAIQDLVRQCLEDNVLWYRVRTDEGLEGYVSGRFLNE